MNMVFNTPYNDRFAMGFINQVSYYSEEILSPFFIQDCISVLDSKVSLEIDLVVSVCHFYCFIYVPNLRLSKLEIFYHNGLTLLEKYSTGLKSIVTILTDALHLISIRFSLKKCIKNFIVQSYFLLVRAVGSKHLVTTNFNPWYIPGITKECLRYDTYKCLHSIK